jgi:hypothetical protein
MRAMVAALLLLSASALPGAAHADTVDVMTVSGGGHTYIFDYPLVETFDYPATVAQFVPGLTPLSETIDGASVTPTELFFHPGGQNIIGPFGTIMYLNVLDILSFTGPYYDQTYPGGYSIYSTTFDIGTWPAFGTTFTGSGAMFVDYTVNIQAESITATPEPPGLILLATALIAMFAFLRRASHA